MSPIRRPPSVARRSSFPVAAGAAIARSVVFIVALCLGAATCGRTGLSAEDLAVDADAGTCVPTACATAKATCGELDGPCGPEKVCVGVGPTACSEEGQSCASQTCEKLSAKCGSVNDGCANIIECGPCAAGTTCGGSGIPNHCGCTATTCDAQGASCGAIPDGCGAMLECGACPVEKASDVATHQCVISK